MSRQINSVNYVKVNNLSLNTIKACKDNITGDVIKELLGMNENL